MGSGHRYSCYFDWYSRDAECNPFSLILRRLGILLERRREDSQRVAVEGRVVDDSSSSNSEGGATRGSQPYWNFDSTLVGNHFKKAFERVQAREGEIDSAEDDGSILHFGKLFRKTRFRNFAAETSNFTW